MHFSSVFTREDISSFPVSGTRFNGMEGGGVEVGAVIYSKLYPQRR